MTRPLSVSVIMPALNEENNIVDAINNTLKAFDHYKLEGEIYVINDGSTDKTPELIKQQMKIDIRVKTLNHEKPMGIGFSFMDGAKHATKDTVVMFPGDNENDPKDALRFIELMNQVDIIVPFIHNIEVRDQFRRIVSSLYRFIINISFGINLNYTNGTVFYRRCLLQNIELYATGFFYQAELLIRLIRSGYLYAEVPNILLKRNTGKSKAISFKSLKNVMKSYLKLAYLVHFARVEGKAFKEKQFKDFPAECMTHQRYQELV